MSIRKRTLRILSLAAILFPLFVFMTRSQGTGAVIIDEEHGTDSVQKDLTDCHYFPPVKSYKVSDAWDKETASYKFFDGKDRIEIDGQLWKKLYRWDTKGRIQGEIEIALFYSNIIQKMGGKVLFYNICENPNCGDRLGFKVLTATLTVNKKELWIEVSPYNDGFDYELIVVEKF
ncbi:MAG: OmpA-like protein [Bacteroidota bacterium]|nr:OmpA-like protein [Bacteroidota bacterium]